MIVDKITLYNKNHLQLDDNSVPDKEINKIMQEVDAELRESIQNKVKEKIRLTFKSAQSKNSKHHSTINTSINLELEEEKDGDKKDYRAIPSVESICEEEAE